MKDYEISVEYHKIDILSLRKLIGERLLGYCDDNWLVAIRDDKLVEMELLLFDNEGNLINNLWDWFILDSQFESVVRDAIHDLLLPIQSIDEDWEDEEQTEKVVKEILSYCIQSK